MQAVLCHAAYISTNSLARPLTMVCDSEVMELGEGQRSCSTCVVAVQSKPSESGYSITSAAPVALALQPNSFCEFCSQRSEMIACRPDHPVSQVLCLLTSLTGRVPSEVSIRGGAGVLGIRVFLAAFKVLLYSHSGKCGSSPPTCMEMAERWGLA